MKTMNKFTSDSFNVKKFALHTPLLAAVLLNAPFGIAQHEHNHDHSTMSSNEMSEIAQLPSEILPPVHGEQHYRYSVVINELSFAREDDELTTEIDAEAWVGTPTQKIGIKNEFTKEGGVTKENETQLLYQHALSTYWDTQVGIRNDSQPSPSQQWLVLGIAGLAPGFIETETALFIGESGKTAWRVNLEYELLITQKFMFVPEVEFNLYGKDDAEYEIESGLVDSEMSIKFVYEITRKIAPYIKYTYHQSHADTKKLIESQGEHSSNNEWSAGVSLWF